MPRVLKLWKNVGSQTVHLIIMRHAQRAGWLPKLAHIRLIAQIIIARNILLCQENSL
jgi:hypothetical protein